MWRVRHESWYTLHCAVYLNEDPTWCRFSLENSYYYYYYYDYYYHQATIIHMEHYKYLSVLDLRTKATDSKKKMWFITYWIIYYFSLKSMHLKILSQGKGRKTTWSTVQIICQTEQMEICKKLMSREC